jgi:hypothetical protein
MSAIEKGCGICEREQAAGGFCLTCAPLARRTFNRRRGRKRDRVVDVPTRAQWHAVLRRAWDGSTGCFRCEISGVRLDVNVPALYPTLDHSAPGASTDGWLVVCAAVNDMKSDLSLDEARKAWRLLASVADGNRAASEELERHLEVLKHFSPRAAVQVLATPKEVEP